jgi:hypothetical protein
VWVLLRFKCVSGVVSTAVYFSVCFFSCVLCTKSCFVGLGQHFRALTMVYDSQTQSSVLDIVLCLNLFIIHSVLEAGSASIFR